MSQVIISKIYCISSLKIDFVLANSADSYEMPHYVAFHMGLHFLPRYPLGKIKNKCVLGNRSENFRKGRHTFYLDRNGFQNA